MASQRVIGFSEVVTAARRALAEAGCAAVAGPSVCVLAEPVVSTSHDSHFAPLLPPNAPHVRASIFSGSGTGQSIDLRRAVSLVGSRPGCKIALRHPAVGPIHCAIVNTGDAVYLRDLFSKTGTFLNGLRAECEKLADGDVIRVGAWEVALEIRAPEPESSSGHMDLEPTPTVVALKHNGNGSMVRLRREINIVGRKTGADFTVNDPQASRAHALVFMFHGHPVVCDLLSENGLRVNGAENAFSVLKSGDTLQLGGTPLRVVIPSPTVQVPRQADSSVMAAETVVRGPEAESDLIDIRSAEIRR